jgi:hypothetical protein
MCVCIFDKVRKYFFGSKDTFRKNTYESEPCIILEEKEINKFLPNLEKFSIPQDDEDQFEIL